jgi:hypothetical protein
MRKLRPARIVLSTVILIACAGNIDAELIQYMDSSGLSPSDSVFADNDPYTTKYTPPSVSFGTPDNSLTWTSTDLDELYLSATAGPANPFTYTGTSFPDGTHVFVAFGAQNGTQNGGAITLSFSSPVQEFGVNIEDYNPGAYIVQFTAYNGVTSLGTFSASGYDDCGGQCPDGTPGMLSFEGAAAINGDVITSVVFDDTAAGGTDNFAFGPVTYGDAPVVPEPPTFILFGIAGVSSALAQRWFARRSQRSDPGFGSATPLVSGHTTGSQRRRRLFRLS